MGKNTDIGEDVWKLPGLPYSHLLWVGPVLCIKPKTNPPKIGLGGLNIIRAALQLSDIVRFHHAPCQC